MFENDALSFQHKWLYEIFIFLDSLMWLLMFIKRKPI